MHPDKKEPPPPEKISRHSMRYHVTDLLVQLLRGGSSKPNFSGNLHLGIDLFTIHSDECYVVFGFGQRILDFSTCYHRWARNGWKLDFGSISEQQVINFLAANAIGRAIYLDHLLRQLERNQNPISPLLCTCFTLIFFTVVCWLPWLPNLLTCSFPPNSDHLM